MIEVNRDDDDTVILVGGKPIEVLDDSDPDYVQAACKLEDLEAEPTTGFPRDLMLEVRSEDGFGTYLFHDAGVTAHDDGLRIQFCCHQPNKHWEGRYGLAAMLGAVGGQVERHEGFLVEDMELEADYKLLYISTKLPADAALSAAIRAAAETLKAMVAEAEIALGGLTWKKEYAKDEKLFCTEVLHPLLRRMGFLSVRYRHGVREYGKDFTFSEMTPFGMLRHYGLRLQKRLQKGTQLILATQTIPGMELVS